MQRAKYGEVGRDDTDDETDMDIDNDNGWATAKNTRVDSMAMSEKMGTMVDAVKKLGPISTAFTVFKSYVATGVLYMPNQFYVSGWLFTAITLLISLAMNLYSCKLLLEVQSVTGGSLTDIGYAAFGRAGKISCDILLVLSQFGFCTAYVYFIASQLGGEGGVIQCATSHSSNPEDCSDGSIISKWYWLPITMACYLPLTYVRKMEKLSFTHIFSDILIIFSIMVLCIYAGIDIKDRGGWAPECIEAISP